MAMPNRSAQYSDVGGNDASRFFNRSRPLILPSSIEARFVSEKKTRTPSEGSGRTKKGIIEVNGERRYYRLYLPNGHDKERSGEIPLVINLHGFSYGAAKHQAFCRMDRVADAKGFGVLYPQARRPDLLWGLDSDHAYIEALIDMVLGRHRFDTERIYATGFSAGGSMVHYMGSTMSDTLAGIATVSGNAPLNNPIWPRLPEPDFPLPVMMTFNTRDVFFRGTEDTLDLWKEWNGCTENRTWRKLNDDVLIEGYENCANGTRVLLYTYAKEDPDHGTHFWPWSRHGLEPAREMWRFFSNQTG